MTTNKIVRYNQEIPLWQALVNIQEQNQFLMDQNKRLLERVTRLESEQKDSDKILSKLGEIASKADKALTTMNVILPQIDTLFEEVRHSVELSKATALGLGLNVSK